jgi:hypothetical protein
VPGSERIEPVRAASWLFLAIAVPMMCQAGRARAFNSYPPGAPHDQITAAAATGMEMSEASVKRLKREVRSVDRRESHWTPGVWPGTWLRFKVNASYRPEHHCDRAGGISDSAAFFATCRYIRSEVQSAIDYAGRGESDSAVTSMGRALHALQDSYSHSNYVDLDAGDQAVMDSLLWSRHPPDAPVGKLRITGYDPAAKDPEQPPGDEFSHRLHSKDSDKKNAESRELIAERTKYELAKEAAVRATAGTLRLWRSSLPDSLWRWASVP